MSEKNITRVLLTGASGFFGSHLLRHLLMNTDWHIVCIVSWKHKGTPERVEGAWKDLDKSRVTIIRHDLEALFTEHTQKIIGKIDYILNIASNSHVDRSIEDPRPFIVGNVESVLTMLEFARIAKPKLFLQFSTDEVYGPAPVGVNFKEGSPIKPSNPYSASKASQEAIAFSYWRTYDVPVIITNTMNLVGQTQDTEKYPAQLIRKIYKGDKVTVHGKPNDIGSRFYIHARNASDAVLYIVRKLPPAHYVEDLVLSPSQYNIVGETELNNLELAEMTARLMGKELKYEFEDFHKTRPGHDRRYALSGERLKNLGWQPPEGFEDSWKRSIEWTLEHKEWL
jgi:dTDP-glucose 4,6-dehydratase